MNDKFDPAVIDTIPAQPDKEIWVSANLTTQVQAWVNGQDNYGIMFISTSEETDAEYGGRSYSEPPYLEITTGQLPIGGTGVTVTGTLANGTTRSVSREDIQLWQTPDLTTDYQPGAADTADSYIQQGELLEVYGIDNYLQIEDDQIRSLLRFDLSNALPRGALVTSANLELYTDQVDANGSFEAYGLQREWVEGDCATAGCGANWTTHDGSNNWDTQGGDFDAEISAEVDVTGADTWYGLDVTDIVNLWLSGERVNHGLLLKGRDGLDMRMHSSDNGDASRHPRLALSYTCECGISCEQPQGSGNIAFIYQEQSGQLPAADQNKIDLMQAWGYNVDTYDDLNLGALTPSSYDSLFISSTTLSTRVGDQFNSTDSGIVSEDSLLSDDFDMASVSYTQSGTNLDIIDNSHFLLSPFAPGTLPVYSQPMEVLSYGGTVAAGVEALADIDSLGSLVVADTGASLLGGATAAGRRVLLPLGRSFETNFNWDFLNNNGLIMVQRALEWSKAQRCEDDDYRDNFDTASFANNDGSVNWLSDWSEQDGQGSGPGTGNAQIINGELRLDDRPQAAGPRVRRDFNLAGADSAQLSFDFRISDNVEQGLDQASLQIRTDSGSWTDLVDFSVYAGGDQGSLQFHISAFISPASRIRIRITDGYGGNGEYLYIDNLRISVCGNLN